jgi:hypothetical protein
MILAGNRSIFRDAMADAIKMSFADESPQVF